MKRKTTKSTTLDNLLGFIWSAGVLCGTTYLVFWRGESGAWYLLALILMSVSVYHEKIEEETN